jgi:hypothetical protein
MKRTKVSSSSIASLGYNAKTKTLEVEFNHGGIFQYFDVPKAVYNQMLAAESVGRYFLYEIKGAYSYAPVYERN